MGFIDGFTHVGCEPWCSRSPLRAPVAEILRWATPRAGMIGGPAWTGIGLHALLAPLVCTSLGCREGYRPGGHGGPHVYWASP